ncbi:hypothetical protein [Leptolyngbya sp. 7M]|uniref:hypothetical protein n=1 Tax=Leptolyngbya sp. 7M TaxID=2812896 RepID=UPI001B8BC7A4|nr:hypothetical protein [Leptolyngbya sp. 7M]QYO66526.1 hypothetical protein JVX88_06920 [Leptolyngbya sp. 7M]
MPKDDRSMYWFTEYYTYLTMFRAGLISQETLVAEYNDLIREYCLSPVRNESNERIIRDFWSDPRVQRLPYLRGFMLALNWNAAIQRASGEKRSLDDLMFDLMKTSDSGKRELSPSLFAERASQIVGRDVAGDFERQIERGETIVPAADALGSDVGLRMESLKTFELGFDLENLSKTKEFSGVKPDTAAYRAGLRNGQKLIGGLSVALKDPTKQVELKVADGNAEKIIKYLPAAAEPVSFPQFFILGKNVN